jgi:hypothetical protein
MTGWNIRRVVLCIIGAAIILTCIIFAIPFITVTYYTTESYYETEITQEPYTVIESYTTSELSAKEEVLYDATTRSVPHGIRVPFVVTNDDTRLVGSFELPGPGGLYIYGYAGKIVYEKLGERSTIDIALPAGEYEALVRERISWEYDLYLKLVLTWIEPAEVIRDREVTAYREVPVTVEKQRTLTNYKKTSLWKIIFGRS